MKLFSKSSALLAGLLGVTCAIAVAIAQVPSLQITTPTGTEQIELLIPSTGTLVTSPQKVQITTANLARYTTTLTNGINAQTGTTYTVAASDLGKLITFNNSSPVAVTLPQAGTGSFIAAAYFEIENIGAGAVTITPTTSTINGSSTLVINQNRGAGVISDGTNYQVEINGAGFLATPATIAEGGTGSATAATARTALAVPGLATTNTFTGTLNQFGGGAGVPGHIATGQTTAPALTSCGGGSPAITGTDTAGIVTMGTTATGCVITFNVAYTGTPFCVVTWIATPLASQSYATSNTAITLTQTSTSGNKAQYICMAPSGG